MKTLVQLKLCKQQQKARLASTIYNNCVLMFMIICTIVVICHEFQSGLVVTLQVEQERLDLFIIS
jgi:hypothetical protein